MAPAPAPPSGQAATLRFLERLRERLREVDARMLDDARSAAIAAQVQRSVSRHAKRLPPEDAAARDAILSALPKGRKPSLAEIIAAVEVVAKLRGNLGRAATLEDAFADLSAIEGPMPFEIQKFAHVKLPQANNPTYVRNVFHTVPEDVLARPEHVAFAYLLSSEEELDLKLCQNLFGYFAEGPHLRYAHSVVQAWKGPCRYTDFVQDVFDIWFRSPQGGRCGFENVFVGNFRIDSNGRQFRAAPNWLHLKLLEDARLAGATGCTLDRGGQVLTVYYSVGDPVTMLVGQSLAAELALWTLVYFGTPAARPGAPATSAVWFSAGGTPVCATVVTDKSGALLQGVTLALEAKRHPLERDPPY